MTLSGSHRKEPETSRFPRCSQPTRNHPDSHHLLLNERVSTRTQAPGVRGDGTGSWEGGAGAGPRWADRLCCPSEALWTHGFRSLTSRGRSRPGSVRRGLSRETEERGPHTHSRKGAPFRLSDSPEVGPDLVTLPPPSGASPALKSSCVLGRGYRGLICPQEHSGHVHPQHLQRSDLPWAPMVLPFSERHFVSGSLHWTERWEDSSLLVPLWVFRAF